MQLHQLPEQTYIFIRHTTILKNKVSVRLEILIVMLLRIQVFLGVTLCRRVSGASGRSSAPSFLCQAIHKELVLQCSTVCDIPQDLNPK